MEIKIGTKVRITDLDCCVARLHNDKGIVVDINSHFIVIQDEEKIIQAGCIECVEEVG